MDSSTYIPHMGSRAISFHSASLSISCFYIFAWFFFETFEARLIAEVVFFPLERIRQCLFFIYFHSTNWIFHHFIHRLSIECNYKGISFALCIVNISKSSLQIPFTIMAACIIYSIVVGKFNGCIFYFLTAIVTIYFH